MSAQDQMRAMLDQLMGTGRNGESATFQVRFSDSKVCKSFLLGCCPHEILTSTRMDLGECPRIHDLALQADYEKAQKTRDYFYDLDAMEHLQAFIGDCDRRTEAAKLRLAETQEELTAEVAVKANSVHELAEQIGQKLAKAEQLGADGHVDESMQLMVEVDELRRRKQDAEQDYRDSMPASSYQQQKLRVCEVCSAYLGIHDNDRRLADHFGGKLHLGFIKIREKLADLEATAEKRKEERRKNRGGSGGGGSGANGGGTAEDGGGGGERYSRESSRRQRDQQQLYVGSRELDRRSRRHRSRSKERRERERERQQRMRNSHSRRDSRSRSPTLSEQQRRRDSASSSSSRRKERNRD